MVNAFTARAPLRMDTGVFECLGRFIIVLLDQGVTTTPYICILYIYIYILRSFFLCYTGEALEGPISTGVSSKLNNIDSNNGILISK